MRDIGSSTPELIDPFDNEARDTQPVPESATMSLMCAGLLSPIVDIDHAFSAFRLNVASTRAFAAYWMHGKHATSRTKDSAASTALHDLSLTWLVARVAGHLAHSQR